MRFLCPLEHDHLWVIYGLRTLDDPEYRYVGLTTVGPELRLKRHIYDARKQDRYVSRWVNLNVDSIAIDILECCPIGNREHLYQAEITWIANLKELGNRLTNHSLGGESGSSGASWTLSEDKVRSGVKHPMYGKHHTQETKDLLSSKKSGTLRSEESKLKQGESIRGENHWAFGGGKFSDEHRRKISEAGMGRRMSEETKKKLSDSHKANPMSEEHRAIINAALPRGVDHHMYGKPALNKGIPSKSAHTRWHTNKEVSKPETCVYCAEDV